MPKKKATTPKPLSFHKMIRRGNLAEVKQWIADGHPIRTKASNDARKGRSMLELAIDVGFYSLVECLLENGTWTKEELGNSLRKATNDSREDLIILLLSHNAPWESAYPHGIIRMMNEELIRKFLSLGMSFESNDAFFEALDSTQAKPLLRLYKIFHEEYPELEDQMAKALTSAVQDKKVRWTILLLWAGADPNRPVPYNIRGPINEIDGTTTALDEAYLHGDLEFLEKIKIEPKGIKLNRILDRVVSHPKPESVARIIRKMTDSEINATEHNSCKALEDIVGCQYYDFSTFSWIQSKKDQDEKDQLESIRILIDAGARWNPPEVELSTDRKGLSSYSGKYVVQVIRLLVYTQNAAPIEKIWELCRTPKMKNLIYVTDRHLWRELNQMAGRLGLKGTTKRNIRNSLAE